MKACQDDLHVHVSQCIGEHVTFWPYKCSRMDLRYVHSYRCVRVKSKSQSINHRSKVLSVDGGMLKFQNSYYSTMHNYRCTKSCFLVVLFNQKITSLSQLLSLQLTKKRVFVWHYSFLHQWKKRIMAVLVKKKYKFAVHTVIKFLREDKNFAYTCKC